MSTQLVTIAKFGESVDAYTLRSHLERKGIPAVVVDHLADGGAELRVDASNASQARELLIAEVSRDEDLTGYWQCKDCQVVVDPGFDVCWSCLRHSRDVRDEGFRPTRTLVSDSDDLEQDLPLVPLNFHRAAGRSATDIHPSFARRSSVGPQGLELIAESDSDERIVRAWRASVLGLLIFPPLLNLYSMYLLVRVGITLPALSRRATRRFYAALIINILSGLALGLYQWLGLFG